MADRAGGETMRDGTDGTGVEVHLVLDARAEIGEGPVWDDHSGELVWVDIAGGLVHRISHRPGILAYPHVETLPTA